MLKTIGNKIRTIRESRGFTQKNMADKLNMSQTGYAKIERNQVDVAVTKLNKICEALGIDLIELVSFDESLVFNVSHNQSPAITTINGVNYQVSSKEEILYQQQIEKLELEVKYLRNLIEKMLGKENS
jgi:transcriptional regulator with XRE-family HTH domain